MIGSLHRFERERDTLSATDAERNDSLADPVALHRMQETGREHRARCADRVTMRDGAAFDIDDVFGKTAPVRRSRAIRSLGRRKTRV